MDFSLTQAQRSAERAQVLPFTRIPPASRGELLAFALFVTIMTTHDPLRRSGYAIAQWAFMLVALVGMLFYIIRRTRINGTMPQMRKAPAEIKHAYKKFAVLYLVAFLAGFLSSILLPLPWAWVSPPATFFGMYRVVHFYEKWYYQAVRAVEERLA
ncbi:hypothetical protein V3M54_01930 [Trueperella pyogenes]|uniref:hypothetical protein n=1 Tax=Trueperella pyogenes TaxID=1661 RepID=UPI00345DC251